MHINYDSMCLTQFVSHDCFPKYRIIYDIYKKSHDFHFYHRYFFANFPGSDVFILLNTWDKKCFHKYVM